MTISDTKIKPKALAAVAIVFALGLISIIALEYFRADMVAWFISNLHYLSQYAFIVFIVVFIFMSPIIAAAIYLTLLGHRVVKSERFPPPNFAAFRRTTVIYGMQAVWRGRIVQLLSSLVLCMAAAIPFLFWSIFLMLAE